MNYKEMMKDCVSYINHHPEEKSLVEKLGKIHSYKGEYISWLFHCYYKEPLETYLARIKKLSKIDWGGVETPIMPVKRHTSDCQVLVKECMIEAFYIAARPVVRSRNDLYNPIESTVNSYKSEYDKEEASISLWWHDEEYSSHYMQGKVCNSVSCVKDEMEIIPISKSKYVVFCVGKCNQEEGLAEQMKYLVHYAHMKWIPKYERRVDSQGYSFECIKEDKVYYCLALLEEEKEEPLEKVYGVDEWTRYINENIFSNLTTATLAKKFHYSNTHFKRVFRYYYKMSVSDYIRKRRLTLIADKIRAGMDYVVAAELYGYKTYAGFKKAFEKEFNMSPAVYSKGVFETINLAEYYSVYRDRLKLCIVELKSMKMIGHTVFPSKGSDVDLAAQINYWIGKDFPCLKNTRFSCNVEQREDKIALWHFEKETGDIEYILGPVVKDFSDDIPKDMQKVVLKGGKYAIFETEKLSDEDDIAETLRMYARCVFYGWVKEHRERVDLDRITFERYVNGKIYLYVPVKE